MTMRARSISICLLPLLAALLLSACGQQAAAPTQTLPPTQAALPQIVPSPVAAPSPASPADDLASIPQGRTAEGYQLLGVEGAPVTLVMYSDFF
jgi:hypothetical protein